MFRLWQHRYSILIIVLVLCGISWLINHTTAERAQVTIIEEIVNKAFNPIRHLMVQSVGVVNETFQSVAELKRINAENDALKEKLSEFDIIKNRLFELEAENKRLRSMLELKNKTEQYQLLAADIVAKSPSNWNGSFMINKGSSEGIAKDMAVVSNNLELVGRVITVSEHSSLVLPILDQRSAVGARVQRSREEGVVKGILEQANYCQLTRLPRDADVKKGDMVITSGLGGIFPDGLVIGKVTKVEKGSLAVTAIIKPSAQFNRIEEVFVIQNVLKEEAEFLSKGEVEE